jgi:hypothetical protein
MNGRARSNDNGDDDNNDDTHSITLIFIQKKEDTSIIDLESDLYRR